MTDRAPPLAALGPTGLPTERLMDLQVARFEPISRQVTASAHLGPEFADARGFVRGGYLAALLDDVMTAAALQAFGADAEPGLLTQNVNYFGGGLPGLFSAEGRIVTVTSTHCIAEAEVRAPDGVPVAAAQGIIVLGMDCT